jgi:hypothetical protein
VYVPNVKSQDIYVIDPEKFEVVDHYVVGGNPQHVIPSWDLKTLWVAGSAERKLSGILTPIDPKTGKPGTTIKVPDAYNLYFTPDGKSAIVVGEALKQLEFRDPQTMKLQYNIATPQCVGESCGLLVTMRMHFHVSFCGGVIKIDLAQRKIVAQLKRPRPTACPRHWNFAGRKIPRSGICRATVSSDRYARVRKSIIPTGRGAHGLYPSRDGTKSTSPTAEPMGDIKAKGPGSFRSSILQRAKSNKRDTGRRQSDMGNVSADGKRVRLSAASIRSLRD